MPLGRVVRLQVQRSSLKVGERPARRYDPTPILAVPELLIGEDGSVGLGCAGPIVDVHNRKHPASKNRGDNGISIGFTSQYREMRRVFGKHLADGIAGENVLIEVDSRVHESELADGLAIETAGGQTLILDAVIPAEPCVEFTRFALGISDLAPDDPRLREALAFLRQGTRGFYSRYRGPEMGLRVGDWISRRTLS